MSRNLFLILLGLSGCGVHGDLPGAATCIFERDLDDCDGRDNDCDGMVDEDRDCQMPDAKPGEQTPPPSAPCRNSSECDDGKICTIDLCTPSGCVNHPQNCGPPSEPCLPSTSSDCDNDGVTHSDGDCNDRSAEQSPSIAEDADHGNVADGFDNDCDGTADEWGFGADRDGDKVPDRTDCDPTNALRWTGAPELCSDSVDSNCNGADNDNGMCFTAVGAIDGVIRDFTSLRVAIAGEISRGLIPAPSGNITRISIGSEINLWSESEDAWWLPWQGEGSGVLYSFTIPRAAFTARVRSGNVSYLDLRKWRATGVLVRAPSKTGRWGITLIAP